MKLRSTQLDALLRQWDMYEEMLQQYEAGSGSMAREAEKTANSLEGRLNEFSNSWTNFINEFLDVDLLTSFVDSGERVINVLSDISSPLKFIITQVSNLLELVTKIADFAGGIPLLIGGIGLKNVGSPKMFGLV